MSTHAKWIVDEGVPEVVCFVDSASDRVRARFVNASEVEQLKALVRDMHGVMWACRESICTHRENGCWRVHAANHGAGEGKGVCWFEERMRELGVM